MQKSRSHWTHMKKPSPFKSVEKKPLLIEPIWESRFSFKSVEKKPFSFNPCEKTPALFYLVEKSLPFDSLKKPVHIQLIWRSRSPFNSVEEPVPHSTHLKKPVPHSIQLKKRWSSFRNKKKSCSSQVIQKSVLGFRLFLMGKVTSELRSPFGPSGRLASRRLSARLEPSLKRLAGWVSWHQRAWASNAENEMSVSRIFRNIDLRNFNFQKFHVHNTHQI
jgi:hypothetical protein